MPIVDDHEGFRDAARALLEAEGFDIVGEAADGLGALTEVQPLQQDVVLLDPPSSGLPAGTSALQWQLEPDPTRAGEVDLRSLPRARAGHASSSSIAISIATADGSEPMRDVVGSSDGWEKGLRRFVQRVGDDEPAQP